MAFVESEVVELKAEVVGDICKEVIAFANTKGGTLYIGVSNDGNVLGTKNADQVILQLNNMIRDSIKPDVTMFVGYETQHVGDKDIIAVTIQKGTDRPYYLGSKGLKPSGVYVRNGTSSDPATDTAIRRMIKETDGDSFESMRSLEQNLSFEAAKKQFEKQNIPFDTAKMQTLGMISADGIYSNVALLLSDQCPSTIKAATFSGRNQTKATFDGLYRIDTRDYPEDALREALLNSLVHRDYSFRASTLVSVYVDRIEFVSVGGLPSGIELDDIMLGLSVCRNPKLAAIFYRLQLIEAYGTGMPKIMNAYTETELKPKIEVSSNAFKITLPNRNAGTNHTQTPVGTLKSEEKRILDFIGSNGHIVRSDVDQLLDVSQATANRILKQMVAEGLIYQDGNGRKTKYRRK